MPILCCAEVPSDCIGTSAFSDHEPVHGQHYSNTILGLKQTLEYKFADSSSTAPATVDSILVMT